MSLDLDLLAGVMEGWSDTAGDHHMQAAHAIRRLIALQAAQQHSGMVSVPEDTLIAACAYLTQAAEDIEAWGSYASDYFQKKYGLKDDIRLYKQRASEFEAMAAAQEQQHEM